MINILIIEDNEYVLNMYKIKLKKYNLTFALNGEEGLKELEKNTPDLVILDINVPIMDGIEFLNLVDKKSPILVISNSNESPDEADKVIKKIHLTAKEVVGVVDSMI